MTVPKYFVLDTNVLLHHPEAITSFDDNFVVLPMTVIDNLNYLMRLDYKSDDETVQKKVDKLLKDHHDELEGLTGIRGRSIPKQSVVIDEAQNLPPHEVTTIILRAGEKTKMVCTGDPQQTDSPYLDSSSNGPSHTIEKPKGQDIYGHATLSKSERSPLSAIAADFL